MAANRERRSGAGKRAFDATVLDTMRAVRAGTTTRAHQIQLVDQGDVYDEVDEAEFQARARKRREDESAFIEDDVGFGDDDDDEWGLDEEQKREREISRVNRIRGQNGKPGMRLGASDHVESIWLAPNQVKPGQVRRTTQTTMQTAAKAYACHWPDS